MAPMKGGWSGTRGRERLRRGDLGGRRIYIAFFGLKSISEIPWWEENFDLFLWTEIYFTQKYLGGRRAPAELEAQRGG